jgi:hypothetical protein
MTVQFSLNQRKERFFVGVGGKEYVICVQVRDQHPTVW